MTTKVFWLLCFLIRSSSSSVAGFLPYPGKPIQTFNKDAYNSADSMPGQAKLPAWGTSSTGENRTEPWLLSPTNMQWPKPPETLSPSSDKKKRTKPSLENNTGLRKHLGHYGGGLTPEDPTEGPSLSSLAFNHASRKQADRRLAEAANSVSAHFHHGAASYPKIRSLAEVHPFPEPGAVKTDDPTPLHHFNRPGKISPYKSIDALKMAKPSWVTNRQSPHVLHHFSGVKEDAREEEACVSQCGQERDEVEAYCASEFAVNGIVYNMERLGHGVHLITL
ncbi:hypothetical protein N309_00562, partial [Tinamus guttatus]